MRASPAVGRGHAFGDQLIPRLAQLSSQLVEEPRRRSRLAPPVDLEQAAPLIEAATQLLGCRVGVGMQHRRSRNERLCVAGEEHLKRERPILGVWDLWELHLLPGGARDAGVGVGEEAAAADQRDRPSPRSVGASRSSDRPTVGRER